MTDPVKGTEKQEEELSDEEQYEQEWGEDAATSDTATSDDSSKDDGSETADQEKADDDETVSTSEVPDENEEGSPESSTTDSAENVSDDIWANATEAQKVAFRNARNGLNAMKGRANVSATKQAALEKELKKATTALTEATRVKGEYETNHPELFNEVKSLFTTDSSETTDGGEASETSEVDNEDDIRAVFKAHPDASLVMATDAWLDFQDNLSEADTKRYNSDDPADFIALMSDFKVQEAQAKTKASSSVLDDAAVDTKGSGSRPSPKKTVMTDQEAYDAEWDAD